MKRSGSYTTNIGPTASKEQTKTWNDHKSFKAHPNASLRSKNMTCSMLHSITQDRQGRNGGRIPIMPERQDGDGGGFSSCRIGRMRTRGGFPSCQKGMITVSVHSRSHLKNIQVSMNEGDLAGAWFWSNPYEDVNALVSFGRIFISETKNRHKHIVVPFWILQQQSKHIYISW